MVVALLSLFAPNWRPQNVDAQKAAKAKALIEQGLARVGYDDDVPTLALEAIGVVGGSTEKLGDAPRILANRSALIAVGDPKAVLSVIAQGEGAKLAQGGPSRFRWIEGHAEAKDLVLFLSGEKNARAREGLGLAEKSAPSGPKGAHRPPGNVAGAPSSPPRAASAMPAPPARKPPAPKGAPPAPRRPKPPPPKRS